jgi:hypothetical protein
VSAPHLAAAGRISIANAPQLTDLDLGALVALEGSPRVTPGLSIAYSGLASIELPLVRATGAIRIVGNHALTELRVPDLAVATALSTEDVPLLTTLVAPALTAVPDLQLAGPLTSLALSPQLAISHRLSIITTGFVSLPAIRLAQGASLGVTSNTLLVDLRGLALPNELSDFEIADNPALTSLAGLEAIENVTTFVRIERNDALSSLVGLGPLASASAIEIESNAALTSLVGLDHLTRLSNYLMIAYNPALTSLDGLSALEIIGGSLVVFRNHALASIAALAKLDSVGLAQGPVNGGPIRFGDNPALAPADVAALIARVHQP